MVPLPLPVRSDCTARLSVAASWVRIDGAVNSERQLDGMGVGPKARQEGREGHRGSVGRTDGPVSEKGAARGVYGPAEILLDRRIEKKMSWGERESEIIM